jgi:hypothetical protein
MRSCIALSTCIVFIILISSCGGSSTADDPCKAQDCSGHGTCAVVGGTQATCICDTGYHSVGSLICAPDEPQHTIGCTGQADCPDAICDFETGKCVPKTNDECKTPPAEGGTIELGKGCGKLGDTVYACAAGLVCVPFSRLLDAQTGKYDTIEETPLGLGLPAICQKACDPCQGCETGSCIRLPEGGGFCASGNLLKEGEQCKDSLGFIGLCAAGLSCRQTYAGGAQDPNRYCTMYCTPEEQSYWDDKGSGFSGASTAKECQAGEVCVMDEASVIGNFYSCKPGFLTDAGKPCGKDYEDHWCPYPVLCRNQQIVIGAGVLLVPGVCSPQLNECAAGVCPSGTACRETVYIYNGTTSFVCIGEHALPREALCVEDVDCQSGLLCKPHPTVEKVKFCQ